MLIQVGCNCEQNSRRCFEFIMVYLKVSAVVVLNFTGLKVSKTVKIEQWLITTEISTSSAHINYRFYSIKRLPIITVSAASFVAN